MTKVSSEGTTHVPNCAWEKSNCEYKGTHSYCPHPEHACTCPPSTPDEKIKAVASVVINMVKQGNEKYVVDTLQESFTPPPQPAEGNNWEDRIENIRKQYEIVRDEVESPELWFYGEIKSLLQRERKELEELKTKIEDIKIENPVKDHNSYGEGYDQGWEVGKGKVILKDQDPEPILSFLHSTLDEYVKELIGKDEEVRSPLTHGTDSWSDRCSDRNQLRQELLKQHEENMTDHSEQVLDMIKEDQ